MTAEWQKSLNFIIISHTKITKDQFLCHSLNSFYKSTKLQILETSKGGALVNLHFSRNKEFNVELKYWQIILKKNTPSIINGGCNEFIIIHIRILISFSRNI